MRLWVLVAAFVLTATPVWAQRGLIQEGYREFRAPPEGLEAPELTEAAIVAARGNALRWRDEARARLGPYSRENEAANAAARAAYRDSLSRSRGRRSRQQEIEPEPAELPVGVRLPAFGGYFAYAYTNSDNAPAMTIVSANWRDGKSNAGEPSVAKGLAMLPDSFCDVRDMPLSDLTYLGTTYTLEMAALNLAWLGPRATPPILSGAELSFTRTPTGGMFFRYYPPRALEREMEGTASMLCDIGAAAVLSCALTSEEPKGWGFGQAALRVAAEGYLVNPVLRDGTPAVGRKVCMSTAFRLAN